MHSFMSILSSYCWKTISAVEENSGSYMPDKKTRKERIIGAACRSEGCTRRITDLSFFFFLFRFAFISVVLSALFFSVDHWDKIEIALLRWGHFCEEATTFSLFV